MDYFVEYVYTLQVSVLTYPHWPMGWSPTVLDPMTWALWLPISLTLATLSLEAAPGLVGVMECGVVKLQLVKVSQHAMDAHALNYTCPSSVVCPVTLENGDITYDNESRRVNTSATLSCKMGYRLVGESVINCQLRNNNMATWSESSPMCEGVFNKSSVCFITVPVRRDNLLRFFCAGQWWHCLQ